MKLQAQTLDADWQGWQDSWIKSPEYLDFWVQCLKRYLFPQSHDNWLAAVDWFFAAGCKTCNNVRPSSPYLLHGLSSPREPVASICFTKQ